MTEALLVVATLVIVVLFVWPGLVIVACSHLARWCSHLARRWRGHG